MTNNKQLVKGLKSQIHDLEGDLEAIQIDISNKQRNQAELKKRLTTLKTQVENIEKSKKLHVSEHAIVRYVERVLGHDISEIESKILTESIKDLVEKLGGSGSYPNDGFSVKMKDYTVTTIF